MEKKTWLLFCGFVLLFFSLIFLVCSLFIPSFQSSLITTFSQKLSGVVNFTTSINAIYYLFMTIVFITFIYLFVSFIYNKFNERKLKVEQEYE